MGDVLLTTKRSDCHRSPIGRDGDRSVFAGVKDFCSELFVPLENSRIERLKLSFTYQF
jgi:hypothetical protein